MKNESEHSEQSSYQTLAGTGTSELIRDGSRFLGAAFACKRDEAVEAELSGIREQHPTASHVCYGYRLRPDGSGAVREVFEDDGEPSQTGGYPILQLLKGDELVDVLCLVVRYFGGTELGTGGLSRAYRDAARQALESAGTKRVYETEIVELTLGYAEHSKLEYFFEETEGIERVDATFAGDVSVELEVRRAQVEDVERRLRKRLGRPLT
jgi:uncharacterized YigZ family protein